LKKKIIFISSTIIFVENFLYDLLNEIKLNYEITIITNLQNSRKNKIENINYINLNIDRKYNLVSDLKNIFNFFKIHINLKPDLIVSTTPKSIIFGIILNLFFRTNKVHIYTGIFWSNSRSYVQYIFSVLDKINIYTSKKIFFDSQAQISFFRSKKISSEKFLLINKGSIKGVDTNKFKPDKKLREKFRSRYNFGIDDIAIIYLGRLDKNKGIYDLIKVFKRINKKYRNTWLFLYGHNEMKLNSKDTDYLKNISINDYTNFPEQIIPCFDLFVLPSRREGFGNSVIEASSCGVPCLTSKIWGLEESSIDGLNCIKFQVDDDNDFYRKLEKLVINKQLRNDLGQKGRKFVKQNFESKDVINFLKNEFSNLLN